jgi:large subunit ribosomal protein L6
MSKIGRKPIEIPVNIEVFVNDCFITVSGKKKKIVKQVSNLVNVVISKKTIQVSPINSSTSANMQSGTVRSLINNMINGIQSEFQKKLKLVGVGYRANIKANKITLTLGFSHDVVYNIPSGIEAELPSPTEIILKSVDKELLGQVAAEIRSYRVPESYKGKGIRYFDEDIIIKQAKKK